MAVMVDASVILLCITRAATKTSRRAFLFPGCSLQHLFLGKNCKTIHNRNWPSVTTPLLSSTCLDAEKKRTKQRTSNGREDYTVATR